MLVFVYWIHHKDHINVFNEGYVGVSKNIKRRWNEHRLSAENLHLKHAIKKYGWDSLVKEILLISNEEYCLEIESKLRPQDKIGWNLAKGGGKKTDVKTSKPAPKKPEVKVVEKPKTPEEVRDIKAKQRVEELLNGVDLVPKKEEELLEIEQPKEGLEWLEEQVSLLSEQNEALRAELGVAKADYSKLYESQRGGGGNVSSNETVPQNVLIMFNELQNNLLGNNPERHVYDIIYLRNLLNQLMQLFPFTENYRRF